MYKETGNVCKKLIYKCKPDRILEIGCGEKSTVFFRNHAKKTGSFVLSLEDQPMWYSRVLSVCPDDKNGKIVLSKLVIKNNRVVYDYVFEKNEEYKLVLIDAPGGGKSNFKFLETIDRRHVTRKKQSGRISIDMLEYVFNNVTINGYIVVDGRPSSVRYYVKNFSKFIKVKYRTKKYAVLKKIKELE